MRDMSEHFVAHVKVERIKKREALDRDSASRGAVNRDVVETTNLTIRSSTLDGLRTKVKAHIDLLDEEDV